MYSLFGGVKSLLEDDSLRSAVVFWLCKVSFPFVDHFSSLTVFCSSQLVFEESRELY